MSSSGCGGIDIDLVTCSLCIDTFTDPRALPCLHTFCCSCLESMVRGRQRGTLKCPLCQESHDLPSNGVQGLRPDFRIRSVCESMKSMELNEKSAFEKCLVHTSEDMVDFCIDDRCHKALCQMCKLHHVGHKVVSLVEGRKWVSEKKENIFSEHTLLIDSCIRKLETGKVELRRRQELIRAEIDACVLKYHNELLNKGNQVFNGARAAIESEGKKVDAKLQILAQAKLSTDHLKSKSSTLSSQLLSSQLDELKANITDVNLQIKLPHLETTSRLTLDGIMQLKVKEQSLQSSATVASSSTEGESSRMETSEEGYVKPTSIVFTAQVSRLRPSSSRNQSPSRSRSNTTSPTRASRPYTPRTSRSYTPSPNRASRYGTPSSGVRPPVRLFSPRASPFHGASPSSSAGMIEAVRRERWTQEFTSMGGLAVRPNGYVYISCNDGIDVYTTSGKKLFSSCSENNGDDAGQITFIRSRGRDYLVALDNKEEEIRIYCDSCTPDHFNDLIFTMKTRLGTSFSLCATDNHLLYTYERHGVVQVACLSTARIPLIFKCNVNTEISRHRSMSALENSSGVLVVVASCHHPQVQKMYHPALQAVSEDNSLVWEVTWEQLDSKCRWFDLTSMANDGVRLYALNKRAMCVYLISVDGQCLGSVLSNLRSPTHICSNKENKQLVLAENTELISVYSLHDY